MFIVTTLESEQLGALIRDKRVSLDNSSLLFGQTTDIVDTYFRERIGYNGYVVGLRGRLNSAVANIFSSMDDGVRVGDKLILEAEVDEDDVMRYRVSGVNAAADALAYGMEASDIFQQLDNAVVDGEPEGIEILCVPYVKAGKKVRVTSLVDTLEFDVDGITFVKMR